MCTLLASISFNVIYLSYNKPREKQINRLLCFCFLFFVVFFFGGEAILHDLFEHFLWNVTNVKEIWKQELKRQYNGFN